MDQPWSLIRPHLWMGGHERYEASAEKVPVPVDREFDLVVSLWANDLGLGPADGVEHRELAIPDGKLTTGQIGAVWRLAVATAEAVRAGRNTFVRCHYGYNRSGLVVAQALVELGHSVPEAIALVRRGRSARALNNQYFVGYLHGSR